MKKNWIIGFIIIIGLLIVGYNKAGAEDSPILVVKQCYNAIVKGDATTFNELWANSKKALLIFSMTSKEETTQAAEDLKTAKLEETINGDKATVKVINKNSSINIIIPDINLMKVDGKWKVYL